MADHRRCGVSRNGTTTRTWYQHLYVQVLCAIVLGVLLGHFYPSSASS